MGKTFTVGPGLVCDTEKLVASRLLVQANSGGGKTRTVRRILEQTHGTVQHLIIDPEGEYSTLREKFDYVIAAPKDGDTAAHPRTAALLAETLLRVGVSAILDIYELNPGDRALFVERFVTALVNADRKLWHPVLVGIDEAHVFAPEGGDSVSGKAIAALASRGRKRGFALMAITQRLALLSKTVAAECNNVLIGRCALDVDIKRAADTLGFVGKEERNALRRLEPGQFWAYGAAFGVVEPTLIRVGPVVSRHQEAGQQAAPVPPPTAKVLKLLAQLAGLPAEAEAREKTVADLKADNTQLRRQLAEAQKAQPRVETKTVEKPVLSGADLGRLERIVEHVRASGPPLREYLSEVAQRLHNAEQEAKALLAGVRAATMAKPAGLAVHYQVDSGLRYAAATKARLAGSGSGDASIGNSGLRRILIALAQRNGLNRRQLAVRATMSARSGTFDTYLSRARTQGWVGGSKDRIEITEAGLSALGAYEPLPEGRALLEHWLGELGSSGAARILRALADVYPRALARHDLSEAATMSARSGTFDTYLSRLRTLELIQGKGEIKAADELFT